ncbi:MAG: hypothetical protein ABEJ23_09570 [Haloarculaceae archaeon]
MVDRVAADNPSVETVRATLVRAGRTDRPKVELPEAFSRPEGAVRLALSGRTYHAVVELSLADVPEIRGAYDNARLAREDGGTNRLADWVEQHDLDFERSVLLDVVEPGSFYGLRAPGEEAVYEVPNAPDQGLASIAEQIEGGDQ